MTDEEKAIRWFENIAYECDKLTSGNVSHLRAQIRGMAIRSAEYLTKHSQELASEDLQEHIDECWQIWVSSDNNPVANGDLTKEEFEFYAHHFAQWQKEQMMKDAIEGYVSATIYLAKHCPQDIAEIQVRDSKTAAKVGEKIKVIIIKE